MMEIKLWYDEGVECGWDWYSFNGVLTGKRRRSSLGDIEVEVSERKIVNYGFLWMKKKSVNEKRFIPESRIREWEEY